MFNWRARKTSVARGSAVNSGSDGLLGRRPLHSPHSARPPNRRVALVCADTVAWPLLMDLTADFVYCRLHGSQELYVSGYDDDELERWARRVRAWARGAEPRDARRISARSAPRPQGRDVFVFFDNTAKVSAPANAVTLAALLGVAPAMNRPPRLQPARDGSTYRQR